MGDFGLLVGPLDRVYLGLDFKNLGIDTSGPSLPAEMLVGASYRLGSEPSEAHSLIFSLGQDLLLQGTLKLNAGVEFGYLKRYFLRAGYNLDLQATLFNSTTGLSFGAGILLGQLGADYSFSSFGGQGGVHRFSLSLFLPPMERPGEGAKAPSTPLTVAAPVSPGGPVADKPVEMKFEMTETSGLTKNQLFERGREKEKLGLREEAIDLYLKAVDKDPDFEKAWLRLGQLFLDKSLESYRKALEKNPKNKKLQEWLKNFNQ
jgi:hypothetical protein